MYPCCLTKTEWTLSYITGRTKFSLMKQSKAFHKGIRRVWSRLSAGSGTSRLGTWHILHKKWRLKVFLHVCTYLNKNQMHNSWWLHQNVKKTYFLSKLHKMLILLISSHCKIYPMPTNEQANKQDCHKKSGKSGCQTRVRHTIDFLRNQL